jgi:hypothetical protein
VKGYGRLARLALATLAIAGSAALPLAGCSEVSFPSLRMPPPREDVTMTPDQVQQATDALVTERDQLQGSGQQNPPAAAAGNARQTNAASSARPVLTPVAITGSTPVAGAAAKP